MVLEIDASFAISAISKVNQWSLKLKDTVERKSAYEASRAEELKSLTLSQRSELRDLYRMQKTNSSSKKIRENREKKKSVIVRTNKSVKGKIDRFLFYIC